MNTAEKLEVTPMLYFQYYWRAAVVGEKIHGEIVHTYNPRIIIREFLEELKMNFGRNQENNNFFKAKIEYFKNNDFALAGVLKLTFQKILGEFPNLDARPEFMISMCEEAMARFLSGEYLDNCIARIGELLDMQFDDAFTTHLKLTVDNLIVEFREVGYAESEIRDFIKRAFDHYEYAQIESWGFAKFLPEKFKNNQGDESLKEEFYEIQNGVNLGERLEFLKDLARETPIDTQYFFRIDGLNNTEKLLIGNVTIYNSSLVKLWVPIDGVDKFDETFRRSNVADCVNATVTIKAITPAGGLSVALAEVEFALTCLTSVFHGKNPVRIGLSYFAFSANAAEYSRNTYEDEHENPRNRFSVEKQNLDGGMEKINRIAATLKIAKTYAWDGLLIESLTWARRAQSSKDSVYKLLSFWIAIETLFKKSKGPEENWFQKNKQQKEYLINNVREVLSKHYALGEMYHFGWRLHDHLSTQLSYKRYNIPSDLIKAAGLMPEMDEGVFLRNFISNARKLANFVPNPVLAEKLMLLDKIYCDPESAKKFLKDKCAYASDEILLLYRMRNKIAHDGSTRHVSLPLLARSAQGFAVSLISLLVENNDEQSHQRELRRKLIGRAQQFDLTLDLLGVENPVTVFL